MAEYGELCNECLCHMCENKDSCGTWEGNTKLYCENACHGDAGCMTRCSQYSPSKEKRWNRIDHDALNCNNCGTTFIVLQGYDKMRQCPYCGVIMDGGQDDV